jgi:acetyl esterase/lipase
MKNLSRLCVSALVLTFVLNPEWTAPKAAAENKPAWEPAPSHETLALWPHGVPGSQRRPSPEKDISGLAKMPTGGKPVTRLTDVSSPSITIYQPPTDKQTGAAVLVFPGGGFRYLVIDKEGTEICAWLNSLGITAILVKYRVPDTGPYPEADAAFEDGQRAVGLVRTHAAKWHIDPHRIGVMGFSAGAHLAAVLSNLCGKRIYKPVDMADQITCRPDFAAIIYPAWLDIPGQPLALNPAIPIDPDGPPAFILQAENDPVHVENSVTYFLALKRANIPAEMHIYAEGGHGYGMRAIGKPISNWPQLAAVWLRTIGVLK